MARITLSEARKLLDYSPETGVVRRKVARAGNFIGDVAGYINGGYRKIRLNGKKYQAHRLAWFLFYGKFPEGQIDHINGDKGDNRIQNLRTVSNQENCKNQKIPRHNTTGHIGVSWDKKRKTYISTICVDSVDIWLGRFHKIDDAITARQQAQIKYGFHQNHGRAL